MSGLLYCPGDWIAGSPATDPGAWVCSVDLIVLPENTLLPSLTIEDGAAIAGAVAVVWATAWGVRQIMRVLGSY